MYIALYTSVSEMGSDMFAVAEDKLLASALHWDSPMHLPGVVSRKKDFVPKFGHILASNL
jgi:manganese-dependent inorganic pyrophosphatase